jgi:hypothetical protein
METKYKIQFEGYIRAADGCWMVSDRFDTLSKAREWLAWAEQEYRQEGRTIVKKLWKRTRMIRKGLWQ